MVDTTSVHRLPVDVNQEYRVKLGKSFTFPKENAFHTIKYDFKPKSIDPSQPGRLKVKGDEVSVSMPVIQAESADDVAVFKGARQPCRKECILIINTESGEAILEKISNTILLKGVRDQTKRKKIRSASPLPSKVKPTPPPPSSQMQASHISSKVGGTTTTCMPTVGKSVGKKSTKKKLKVEKQQQTTVPAEKQQSFSSSIKPSSTQQQSSSILSMPALPTSISPIRSNNPTPEPPTLKRERLSSSSRSDLSGSGNESSDTDSDSEMDQTSTLMATQQFTSAPPTTATPALFSNQGYMESLEVVPPLNKPCVMGGVTLTGSSSASSSSSSSDSSDSSESDSSEEEEAQSYSQSTLIADIEMPSGMSSSSRPRTISVLKEDLELSDSDDSD